MISIRCPDADDTGGSSLSTLIIFMLFLLATVIGIIGIVVPESAMKSSDDALGLPIILPFISLDVCALPLIFLAWLPNVEEFSSDPEVG